MKQKILAIRDVKTEHYLNPIVTKTVGEAERGFSDEANNPQSMMSKHPEDFGLYMLGEFDNITGLITPEVQPKHIASAVNVKKPETLQKGAQGAY